MPNIHDYNFYAELAKSTEKSNLEFKSSKLFDNSKKNDLKKCLGKEIGAFANSSGGKLIFGFEDESHDPSTEIIPHAVGRQKIQTYLSQLISTSLEPVLYSFEISDLIWSESTSNNCIVIDVKTSEISPHQSKSDHKYYVRQNDISTPAEHWMITALANKKTTPNFKLLDNNITGHIQGTGLHNDLIDSYIISIQNITLKNLGKVTATKWCISTDKKFNISSQEEIFKNETPRHSNFFYCLFPIFPSFEFKFNLSLRVSKEYFEKNEQITVPFTIHADDSECKNESLIIIFNSLKNTGGFTHSTFDIYP